MRIASIHLRLVRPVSLSTATISSPKTSYARSSHTPLPLASTTSTTNPHRSFVTSQWGSPPPPQTLTATRTLPYSAKACYELIADIDAYRHFIPYCTASRITSLSAVETRTSKRRWPRTAELTVGYGPYNEVFRSRVFCQPYRVLEAVAGEAQTSIPREELRHYFDREEDGLEGGEGGDKAARAGDGLETLFTTLSTRWTFREQGHGSGGVGVDTGAVSTEVNLSIGVGFSSAVYAALSQAAAPKVAGIMIEAFEKRAREVYGPASGA